MTPRFLPPLWSPRLICFPQAAFCPINKTLNHCHFHFSQAYSPMFHTLTSVPLHASQFVFCFGPTELAMYVNCAMSLLYVALLVFTVPGNRRDTALLRPQCRLWLMFLAVCYFASSLGYLLFEYFDVHVTAALWIGELALYGYTIGFGPALYVTFLRERAHWLARESSTSYAERLLEAVVAGNNQVDGRSSSPHTSSRKGAGWRTPLNVHVGASPLLRPPPGTCCDSCVDPRNAEMLRTALDGVRMVRFAALDMHEIVGSGGFAEVFRASWSSHAAGPPSRQASQDSPGCRRASAPSGSSVQLAVKKWRVLPKEVRGLEIFCNEIKLMHSLDHPNVLELVGVTISPTGCLALITPYMSRGSVFQMLHPPPPAPAEGVPLPRVLAMRMLADCAEGMAYLHARTPAVIHRDLKSQNLLVAPDLSVRVADLGLSKECWQAGPMARVGSVQWAAPEVLLGQSYSHKSDLWSFGVVCWEVLTGKIPFDGISQQTVATQVAVEGMRLPVPSRAPKRMLRLIARCWSESPEARPEFEALLIEIQGIENELLACGEPDVENFGWPASRAP